MAKKFLIFLSFVFFPIVVSAHGVGQIYALPIPLEYSLAAAGLAVAFSFFAFAFFLGSEKRPVPSEKVFKANWLAPALKVLRPITAFLILLAILAGIFGNQSAYQNFTPIFFWVYFLIGFGVLSAVFENIWDKLNPWKFLSRLFRMHPEGKAAHRKISPWIGVVLLFGLYWLELSSGDSFSPNIIGTLLLIYTLVNLIMVDSSTNWFSEGEVFSVFFGFIGKLSFFKISEDEKSIIYTPLGKKLNGEAASWASLGVAIMLLAGTSFDSFKETFLWYRLGIPGALGLILSTVPFLLFYLLVMRLMEKLTGAGSWKILARQFVWSLIPIAFGYILAHNFSLIIVTAPQIVALISDPFGWGWNIFHTARFAGINLVLGAKTIWFVEIGFVVAAHIVGTLFAHILATNIMPNKKLVLRSQYPMLVLMLAFTTATLWLLAQPFLNF